MKRLALVSMILLAVAAPALASHTATDFVATGTILIGDPGTRVIGGVTEQGSPCLGSIDPDVPAGLAQGVDGFWIALPEGSGGHAATLTSTAPNDVDAWFYDEGCGLIQPAADPNAYSMATTDPVPNGDEAGTIPANAAFVAVDLYVGAAAPFTFTIPGTPAV
jgi:hypothetical protein